MDTSRQVLSGVRRRRWPIEEKRRIVQETLAPHASVARTAQRYAVNANQIFNWRRAYRDGRLENSTSASLLPVKVVGEQLVEAAKAQGLALPPPVGRLEIQLSKGILQITGAVDLMALRTAIECLVG